MAGADPADKKYVYVSDGNDGSDRSSCGDYDPYNFNLWSDDEALAIEENSAKVSARGPTYEGTCE